MSAVTESNCISEHYIYSIDTYTIMAFLYVRKSSDLSFKHQSDNKHASTLTTCFQQNVTKICLEKNSNRKHMETSVLKLLKNHPGIKLCNCIRICLLIHDSEKHLLSIYFPRATVFMIYENMRKRNVLTIGPSTLFRLLMLL
jgi:hypothetical protein